MDPLTDLMDTCRGLGSLKDTSELIHLGRRASFLSHALACNFSEGARGALIIPRYGDMVLPKRMEVTCGRNDVFLKQGKLFLVFPTRPQQ